MCIGDFMNSINYKALIANNITHILVCGEELACRYPEEFTYKKLRIDDTPDTSIREYFQEVYEFINGGIKSGNVLVHCAQAKSRSASMILAYLMKRKNIKFKKALEILKKSHPSANPNSGFAMQLMEYEKEILPKKSDCNVF